MADVESVTVTANSQFQTTAGVECFVDIYTFEGGTYSLASPDILAVTVNKSLPTDTGNFTIVVAPKTLPNNLSWSQIITPMSFAIIGMRRGNKSAIVMLGVVTNSSEEQEWQTGTSVKRGIIISGIDVAYFFTKPDYYTLWTLDLVGQNVSEAAGYLSGTPQSIGKAWYNQIMATGVMANTYFPYKNNSPVNFNAAYGTDFENYQVNVPFAAYFLGINDSWFSRFRAIFPFPFYEFFVTTSFGGNYNITGGTKFTCTGLGDSITATPAVIARINPLPTLITTLQGVTPKFTGIDTSKWNALPNFTPEGTLGSFLKATISFSEEAAYNFYTINPTWMQSMIGDTNSTIQPPLFIYPLAIDQASIARYGYRPMQHSTQWWSDPSGQSAQTNSSSGASSVANGIATALGNLCAYYEASPLMANAQVMTWLRPDIAIGTVFTYAPFKDGVSWDFYVDTVSHSYIFGGDSKTTIGLSRGLPSSVYADSSASGVLFNIHVGNAMKQNGAYSVGLPPNSQPFLTGEPPDKYYALISSMNKRYVTQQLP